MKSSKAIYNQIVIFHSIAKEGSIRGAARKLEMAAPSVSQSLKLLESKLGLPLFNRSSREMTLTEEGKFLLERTQTPIAALDLALEGFHELSGVPSGKVILTVPRFAYQSIIKPIFSDFCRLYPSIELEISVSDTIVNIVREGIDVGIRFGDRIEEGMVARKLTNPIREALFASPSYLEKHGTPQSLNDLVKHKLIQYRFGASNRIAPTLLEKDGKTIAVEMTNAIVVNDTEIIIDAALAGVGIGRFLTPLVENYFKLGLLVPILEHNWHEYPGLYIYFSQNSQKAKRIRALVDFIVDNAKLSFV